MSHPVYGLNELREMFLRFFESKGHLRLPSFSLIPQNDKSILLINAGMTPMKPWFKGEEEPPRRRVCTCQKCIRTGDIDNVGHTARHGTFFEMLGNFSFGDYFKHEAIAWSWEFLTSPEWVGLEPDRLYPSVFAGSDTTPADDEAFAIWRDEVGIPAERIFRFGKEDNFWEHGSGPCGPCSEIYYDRGAEYGCGKPGCTVGCDCDRYVEVWNNVFSQFDNDGHGNYTELKQKNIDTGMGLERLAMVSQNVNSLFDVDTVMHITNKVSEITDAHYGESNARDVSLRIITDHIAPDGEGLVVGGGRLIACKDRRIQPIRLKADPLGAGQEFPCPGNGLLLEIIAEREVAEHLKIGAVARRLADVFDVAGADALLAGRDAVARRLLLTGEPRLHRRHTGVDEQDGFVVARDQRKAGQAQMSLALKEAQVHFTQLVESVSFVCHSRFSFYLQ